MTTTVAEPGFQPSAERSADCQKVLTFQLGEECYGIDILKVQEIKGYTAVTHIPNSPPYVKGVLNLRGTIVPIVDLRLKFGMTPCEPTMFTVVVVVNVRERVMGMLVDAVSDVLELGEGDIQPPPELGASVDLAFIAGMGNSQDRLVTILDIERVFAETDATSDDSLPGSTRVSS
ncbi:MAG: purine-binding chemotaxis protein CheW [Nitrospirae bacterium]|nr:MAG: purine-binding chemotaxis protein CheW [Nitrospirota bacterium]